MKRAEIWWARLPRPDKERPVVLVSREEAYVARELFVIAPVTSRLRDLRSHVAVGSDEGLREPSAINCDRLTTIHRSQLTRRIGHLSRRKTAELDESLRFALGLE